MQTFDTPGGPATPPRLPFDVPFSEAIAWARARQAILPEEFYAARLQAFRARAFAIAGLSVLDQIQAVVDSLAEALAAGQTFRDWQKTVPASVLELGGARRELIFRNAVQTAYGVGRTIQQRENAAARPYLMWDAINDSRTRPTHRAMDGHIAPIDDPIWKRWSPPGGHRCRCSRLALTEAQARARGYPKAPPGVEPDKGWAGDPTEGNEDLVQIIQARQASCATTTFAAKKTRARGLWCDDGEGRNAIENTVNAVNAGGDRRFAVPLRQAWTDDLPDTFICAAESTVKRHPNYLAAKAGSLADAWALVDAVMSTASTSDLGAIVRPGAILVGVQAFEGQSVNRIPLAMVRWLADRFPVELEQSIVQVNRVGHTGSSGWNRLANQALFDGEVQPGARYVLVDDFVGQGGTFANLRGYILAKGGRVEGFVSLTGQPRSARIQLDPLTLAELREKHGELEDWWRSSFGFGFESLTQSEGAYLLRVDARTVRDRVSAARQGGES